MPSSSRWFVLLVPSLLILYTLVGAMPAAEAAPPKTEGGSGECRKCSPDAGTGTDGGTSIPDGGTSDGGAGTPDGGTGTDGGCLAGPVLNSLGKDHLLVGGKTTSSVAGLAPFDVRYIYLAGGLFDSPTPCTSCQSCTTSGLTCSSLNPTGCKWWGCWQWDQLPPGQYLRDFLTETTTLGQLPMITYYQMLHASGVAEGTPEVDAAQDPALMQRYFNDWRFVLKQIGTASVLLHIEPDFWGYAQHKSSNPHLLPAAVASVNSTDCANQPNSIAGMGRCMIAMVRKYAPNAKVGLHASPWGSKIDVIQNRDALLNVEAETYKVADFMRECGAASGDFIVVEASDRDAQYFQVIKGLDRWWDASNASLPHFKQGFRWARAMSERLALPNLWWQLPVGNMSLPGYDERWKDNRLDYFFDHPEEIAANHGIGMIFGAGEKGQTDPATDLGHLVNRVNAHFITGGQPVCGTTP